MRREDGPVCVMKRRGRLKRLVSHWDTDMTVQCPHFDLSDSDSRDCQISQTLEIRKLHAERVQ